LLKIVRLVLNNDHSTVTHYNRNIFGLWLEEYSFLISGVKYSHRLFNWFFKTKKSNTSNIIINWPEYLKRNFKRKFKKCDEIRQTTVLVTPPLSIVIHLLELTLHDLPYSNYYYIINNYQQLVIIPRGYGILTSFMFDFCCQNLFLQKTLQVISPQLEGSKSLYLFLQCNLQN